MGSGEGSTMREFIVCTVLLIKSGLKWRDNVGRMEEDRTAFKGLTGESTRKRSLGRSKRRWEANIRMDLKEICVITER